MHTKKIIPVIMAIGVMCTGCQNTKPAEQATPQPEPTPASADIAIKQTASPRTKTGVSIRITAAGTNNISDKNIKDGNFDLYGEIKEILAASDINIITQQAPITEIEDKISAKTSMGFPKKSGMALTDAGFNLVCQATDHAFDLGGDGVRSTVKFWRSIKSADMIGVHDSEKSFNRILVKKINGIKTAFLNYTASLGGNNMHADEKFYVKTLYNEKTVAKDIKKAKKQADLVVILPYWGMDAGDNPDEIQVAWSRSFVDNGADLIIGSGPKQAQPMEILLSQDGREIPCFYSLGYFLQDGKTGAYAEIEIEKKNGVVSVGRCLLKNDDNVKGD